MQITSIQLTNIKSHRDRVLSFSPGINVLSGPNGVGKSTVFEAIGYALFGVDAQSFVGNADRFISLGSKRGEVSVDFQLEDNQQYRVTRTVGTPSRWLLFSKPGDHYEVEEHKDIRETEARLKELLGLDNGRPLAEQFELVIGPFQNDFLGPFVIRQMSKRRDRFDEILGIDAWRKTFSETNPLMKALKGKIDVLNAEIAQQRNQLIVLPEREQELITAVAAEKNQTATLKQHQSELNTHILKVAELDNQKAALEKISRQLQELATRIETGKEYLIRQQQQVTQADEAVQQLAQNKQGKIAFEACDLQLSELRRKLQQRRSVEQQISELEKSAIRLASELTHEQAAIRQAKEDLLAGEASLVELQGTLQTDPALTQLTSKLAEIKDVLDTARNDRSRLKGRHDSLLEGRDKLAEGVCPFFKEPCQNIAGGEPRDLFSNRLIDLEQQVAKLDSGIVKLSHELETAEQAQRQVEALRIRAEELGRQVTEMVKRKEAILAREQQLNQRREALKTAESRVAAARENLEQFSGLDTELLRVEKEQQIHQAARDAFYRYEKTAEELIQRQQLLEKYRQRVLDLEAESKTTTTELTRLQQDYDPQLHELHHRQKDALLSSVATLQTRLSGLADEQQRLHAELTRLKQIQQEVADREACKQGYERKEELVKFLRNKVFRHVSGYLSERFREEISQRADRIYRTIAEADEELYWGENYQIQLRDLVDGEIRERSDDQLSGGQTMSAVVALRLAMLQTIGARIAFFDEPTSHLDALRRENLARAFRAIDVGREEVTEHWYDQLFLVSHDVAFTEITDQLIEITPPEAGT